MNQRTHPARAGRAAEAVRASFAHQLNIVPSSSRFTGKIGALVGIFGGERLVDIDAQARLIARVQRAVGEAIGVREDRIGLLGMAHIFLDAEIRHRQVEMQRRRHAVTGDRSVAPWQPVRTLNMSAKAAMRRRWVMPPAWTTVARI